MSRREIKNIRLEIKLIRHRLVVLAVIAGISIVALVGRLIQLQILYHDHYQLLSNKNRLTIEALPAKRGIIYDRYGVALVENQTNFMLAITPEKDNDIPTTITQLSQILSIGPSQIDTFERERKWHHHYEPTRIKDRLSYEELSTFYLHHYAFPSISVINNHRRHYPYGATFAAAIGYANYIDRRDLTDDLAHYLPHYDTVLYGRTGLESYYNDVLQGQMGYRQLEVDASGRTMRTLDHQPPVSGSDLHLTLDSPLQATALAAFGDDVGAVVALDPRNGEVLVLASSPSYDPNDLLGSLTNSQFAILNDKDKKPMFNRAIAGQYPMGSTVKPFLVIGAITHHIIDMAFRVIDHGTFVVPGTEHVFHDWRVGGHGVVDIYTAIVVSCDTFFYELGLKMGIALLDQTLNDFGFGQITGIDLDGEKKGVVSSPWWKRLHKHQNWYAGDTVNAAIGQGLMLATPLQLAVGTGQLVNGIAFRPHLVHHIQPPNGEPINTPIDRLGQVHIPSNLHVLLNRAMVDVISSNNPPGTGFRFGRHADYLVAAKTGTSQVTSRKPKPGEKLPYHLRDDSLFIAYAPDKNPTIAIAVVVEHNVTASVVARRLLDCYFHRNQCTEPNHV